MWSCEVVGPRFAKIRLDTCSLCGDFVIESMVSRLKSFWMQEWKTSTTKRTVLLYVMLKLGRKFRTRSEPVILWKWVHPGTYNYKSRVRSSNREERSSKYYCTLSFATAKFIICPRVKEMSSVHGRPSATRGQNDNIRWMVRKNVPLPLSKENGPFLSEEALLLLASITPPKGNLFLSNNVPSETSERTPWLST